MEQQDNSAVEVAQGTAQITDAINEKAAEVAEMLQNGSDFMNRHTKVAEEMKRGAGIDPADAKAQALDRLDAQYAAKQQKIMKHYDKKDLNELRSQLDKLQKEWDTHMKIAKRTGDKDEMAKAESVMAKMQSTAKVYIDKCAEFEGRYGEKYKRSFINEAKDGIVNVMDSIGDKVSDAKEAVGNAVKDGVNKFNDKVETAIATVGEAYEKMAKTSVAAVENGVNTLKETNAKFRQVGKEAYVGFSEKMYSIDRAAMMERFAQAKEAKLKVEVKLASLTERYEKTSKLKEGIKNLGRVITGQKAVDLNEIKLTPEQQVKVDELNQEIRRLEEIMDNEIKDFAISYQQSLEVVKDNKYIRESLGMEESVGLDEVVKAANEQSQEFADMAKDHIQQKTGLADKDGKMVTPGADALKTVRGER